MWSLFRKKKKSFKCWPIYYNGRRTRTYPQHSISGSIMNWILVTKSNFERYKLTKLTSLNFHILKPQLNPTLTELFPPEILWALLQVLTCLRHDQTCQSEIKKSRHWKMFSLKFYERLFSHKEEYKPQLFLVS